MSILELSFASSEHPLSVRSFSVEESLSGLFRASIVARSPHDDVDLDAIVGAPALFRVASGKAWAHVDSRSWTGVCSEMELVRVEPNGLSTYEIVIVPALWMLTQRYNCRLFQHKSVPEIAAQLLTEHKIRHVLRIDDAQRASFPKLELRAQYNETDYAFMTRLLEEAGISFFFEDDPIEGSQLVLSDRPHAAHARPFGALPFVDDASLTQASEQEHMTEVRLGNRVRPGRVTIRDFDFRRPGFALVGESKSKPVKGTRARSRGEVPEHEHRMEQFLYQPGAFASEGHEGADTPVADDKGVNRHHHERGHSLAELRLEAERASKQVVSFKTTALDLSPGTVFTMSGHPRKELGVEHELLVTSASFQGEVGKEWTVRGTAAFAALPYRPKLATHKPRIYGVQSAIVVGPVNETVHTDEFGRVRVQFHWDREGRYDDSSSAWIRVSQAWAGPGYGMINLPRVGHEVLVGFLDGDPDHPIIVGRVFNGAQQVPYKLPDAKLSSAWKSDSNSNIILFVDIPGHEGFLEQAERDRLSVVKHDQIDIIGNSTTQAVRADQGTVVGGNYARGVMGNYELVTGGEYSLTTRASISHAAGIEMSATAGFQWEAGVTPVLPLLFAQLAVGIVRTKLVAAFPAGPPDLMAILQAQAQQMGWNPNNGLPPGVSIVPAIPVTALDQILKIIEDIKGLFKGVLQPIAQALANMTPQQIQQLLLIIAGAQDLNQLIQLLEALLPPPPPGGTKLSDMMKDIQDLFDMLFAALPDTNPAPGSSASSQADDSAEKALKKLQPFIKMLSAVMDEIAPGTGIRIRPSEIRVTTGKATIELKGEDISIKTKGNITLDGGSVSISPSPCKCG